MSETFAEKIARQIAEKAEKAAQDKKDRTAKDEESRAKLVEADVAALRLRVTALVSEYQGIIERIAEQHSEVPASKRRTKFCIFTHFKGTSETLKEGGRPDPTVLRAVSTATPTHSSGELHSHKVRLLTIGSSVRA